MPEPNSPHLQALKTKAQYLTAIATDDDARAPNEKSTMRETFDKAGMTAEIEVYSGAPHGWCLSDTLLALYGKGL